MNFIVKHIPFIKMNKEGLDSWTKAKKSEYIENFQEVPTTYVSIYDLKEKARTVEEYGKYPSIFAPLIWEGTPGFMSRSWVNNYRGKKEYNYRFGTGLYCSSNQLLLVDDVFDWAHYRIKNSKDVRSAFDIMISIKNGELKID